MGFSFLFFVFLSAPFFKVPFWRVPFLRSNDLVPVFWLFCVSIFLTFVLLGGFHVWAGSFQYLRKTNAICLWTKYNDLLD